MTALLERINTLHGNRQFGANRLDPFRRLCQKAELWPEG
jgi:hypothetical protein